MHQLLLAVAEEAAEAGGATRVIAPAIDELVIGSLAFLIFFAFMAKLVFPRLREGLKAREQSIRGELERAEQTRVDAEEQREELRRQLAEARTQADQIMRDETAAAEQRVRDIVSRAEEEARQIVAKARVEAEGERGRVFADLRSQVADLSLEAARRVVERELSDPQAQRQLVDQFISSVGTDGQGG